MTLPRLKTGTLALIGDAAPPIGGVATYCYHVAEGLSARGWRVTLIDTSGYRRKKQLPVGLSNYVGRSAGRSLPQIWRALIGTRHRIPDGYHEAIDSLSRRDRVRALALEGFLRGYLGRSGADIVLTNHAGVRSYAAVRACRELGVPVVVMIHGSSFMAPRLLRALPLALWTCQHAAAVISNSEFSAEAARRHGVSRRITPIHLGVDLQRFEPSAGTHDGVVTLLFAGWVHHNKGADVLLDAIASLPARIRAQLRCRIVGPDHGMGAMLRRRTEDVPEAEMVGPVTYDEMPAVYRSADIFVFPTREYEGFGLAVLEAAASGCAVLASNIGPVPEIIRPGIDGVLFPAGDSTGLAAHIERLVVDREALRRLQRAARRRAETFSWDQTVARTDAVLRSSPRDYAR